jgi:N-acetyl-anhydromuramyl-L-alanine amidase AmpD
MAGNCSIEGLGHDFSKKSRNASSNYGIGTDGRIGMYVEEKHRSWCTSSRALDSEAITIEVANDGGKPNWHVSDKALAALIDLCTDICKRNGIEKLVYTGDKSGNLMKHEWYANTTCPGPYLGGKFPYIAEEVNKRLNGGSAPSAPTVPTTGHMTLRYGATGSQVKELQEKLIFIGYSCGEAGADGHYGKGTESAVKEFQGNNALGVDGVCGPKTWKVVDEVYTFAKSYTLKNFVTDVQKACGAKVDGIAGPETLSKTVTVSKYTNKNHPVVKAI